MNTLRKFVKTALLIGSGILTVSAFAGASSLPGASGHPQTGFAGCFTITSAGTITNNSCSSGAGWDVDTIVNVSGSHTVTVASGTSGTTNSCTLIAMSQNGTIVGSNGNGAMGTGNFPLTVTVPSNGSMVLRCTVSLNGSIQSVIWTM
jgi:pectate lyase